MSRSLSLATRQALMAQETGVVILTLLEVRHDDMPAPLRFVNNQVAVVSNGETYEAFAFDVTYPDDRDDQITSIGLSIDNVDRRVVEAVRSIVSAPVIVLRVINADEPDVMVAGPVDCRLRDVSYTATAVSGTLQPHENITDEPFPQHIISPANFPGSFR